MGFFSRSRSSSSSNTFNRTFTDASNQQINDNRGLVVGEGASVNVTDGGAFETVERTTESAFDFGRDVSAGANSLALESIEAVNESRDDSNNLAQSLFSQNVKSNDKALQTVSALVAENNQDESDNTRKIALAILAAGTIIAGFVFLSRRR